MAIHITTVFTTREEAANIALIAAIKSNSELASRIGIPDVEALIDVACREACNRVFNGPDALRLQVILAITTGSDGFIALDADVIPASLLPSRGGSVLVAGYADYADCVDTIEDMLLNKGIADISQYHVTGGNNEGAILFLTSASGEVIAGTAITVRACKTYLFLDLPEQIKDDFIMVLAEMVTKEGESRGQR